MNTEPISAAAKASGRKTSSEPASAVPTSTSATAAGSVRGRAAISQMRSGTRPPEAMRAAVIALRPPRELREVRPPLLHVGVAALLALLGHVEEHGGVAGELLHPREPVAVGVERSLQHPQREGREHEHLSRPLDRLRLEAV